MATNFPSSLDSFTNPTAVDTLDSPPHDTQHANANDAIEALQSKVGVDGSAVTTSLDYKVANLESRPVETKTASYTLVATDVNKRIVMNSASATTITVDTGIFSAGDTVWIHNIGAGTTTVTAGTATVNTAGSLDVGQWEGGSLYFTSASSAIFFRGGGAVSAANFTDTETGTYSSGGKNYKYITFNASGTLTVDTAGLADILVIGGGGGGGSFYAGGGGAGGFLSISATQGYLSAGTLTVEVGAGGAGGDNISGTNARQGGNNGNPSRISSFISPGGGGGGTTARTTTDNRYGTDGLNGGSGGGGGGGTSGSGAAGGSAGISVIGSAGGAGSGSASGGGGGGASAAGAAGTGSSGGNGGAGEASSITGSSVTYSGGGGGYLSGAAGTGGAGGGGDGDGTAGTANTGGGGGGDVATGGNGGSGIVIVRVEV